MILEYLAFFCAFRYYLWLRRHSTDHISSNHRLSIIMGAIVGALIGSRLVAYLENPFMPTSMYQLIMLLNVKSIMGGLYGGLLGVELSKKIIGEHQSSGDLFTYPIIIGIVIGRIGCFLMGVKEFTYGIETTLPIGMDLGDGLSRHPITLYEISFLIILFVILYSNQTKLKPYQGSIFQIFMISYFTFRFFIEFIKPNIFHIFGLSSIQWLCIACWLYYLPSLKKMLQNAY